MLVVWILSIAAASELVVEPLELVTAEDTPTSAAVKANDSEARFAITQQPKLGIATIDEASGLLTFTPTPDQHGRDEVVIDVSAGSEHQSVRVTISIDAVNDAPVPAPMTLATREQESAGAPLPVTDVDGDTLTFSIINAPTKGNASIDGRGWIVYTPTSNNNGNDRLVVLVKDGTVAIEAPVDIVIASVNEKPRIAAATLSGHEDENATLPLVGIDPDGDALAWSITRAPAHGTASIDPHTGLLSWAPAKDWYGTDAVTVEAKDAALTTSAVIPIAVGPVNDAPLVEAMTLETREREATGARLAVHDVDGDEFTFSIGTGPSKGTATVDAKGRVSYVPALSKNGEDRFVVVVSDGNAKVEAAVDVVIAAINDAPAIAAASLGGREDELAAVNLVATDPEGDAVSWSIVRGPAHGAAAIDATTGRLTFTPTKDWHGTDAITVAAKDAAASTSAVIPVSCTPVNDAPAVDALKLETREGEPTSARLTVRDIDGDPVTFSISAPPTKGTATVDAKGRISFAPTPGSNGSDRFVVVVSDGNATAEAAVEVVIKAVNDAPVIAAASVAATEDEVTSVNLTATDPEGDGIAWSIARAPAHGAATIDATTGQLSFTPAKDWHGTDAITVAAKDASLTTTSVVAVSCAPVNDAPVVEALKLDTREREAAGARLTVSDVDGDALTFSIGTASEKGSASVDAKGRVSYTPALSNNGSDHFVVVVSDGNAKTEAAVDVVIAPVNEAPVISAATLSGNEDEVASVAVVAVDPEADALSWSIARMPAQGSANIDAATGLLTFTPAPDWHGTDAITVAAKDASLTTTSVVAVSCAPVNDAPVVEALKLDTREREAAGARLTVSDVDGDALTFSIGTASEKGSASVDAKGRVSYTPALSNNGSDHFVVVVSDGNAKTEAAVDVVIAPVNEAPVISAATLSGNEDEVASVAVVAVDPEADALSWSIARAPAHGAATIDATTGQLSFTPAKDWHGTDAITVAAKDASLTTTSVVAVSCAPVNDAPVVEALKLETRERAATGSRLSVHDVDGDPFTFAIGTAAEKGSATVDDKGRVNYVPAGSNNGSDRFVVVVSDGNAKTEAAVDVVIAPINEAPVISAASLGANEDEVATLTLTASDPEADVVSWSIARMPAHGSANIDAATGLLTFTPAPDWHGTDAITVAASDASLTTSAVVAVSYTSVNDAPVVEMMKLDTREREAVGARLSVRDVDGDALTFVLGTGPEKGTASVDARGRVNYAPVGSFNGSDRFVISISDGNATIDAAVDVVIAPVNEAPVVPAASVSSSEDEVGTVAIPASDPDGDILSWSITRPPTHGTATIDAATGMLTFSPALNWHGSDALTVAVKDASLTTSIVVPLSYTAVNDAPVIEALRLETREREAVGATLQVRDVDGDALTFALQTPAGGADGAALGTAQKGSASVDAKGRVTYAPAKNNNGIDRFVVVVSDGNAKIETAVDVVIAPVNEIPVITPAALQSNEDQEAVAEVLASDPDGDALSWSITRAPNHGTATIVESSGHLTFSPSSDWHGTDSVTVVVKDAALSASFTLPVTCIAVNDAPVVQPLELAPREDEAGGGTLSVRDVDGDALTFSIGTPPARGNASVDAKGRVSYRGAQDQNGSERFVVIVNDGTAAVEAPVTVVMAAVNDAPVAAIVPLGGSEDTGVVATLSGSDVDGDTLSWSITRAPEHGTATLDDKGQLAFSPALDWHGNDAIQVALADGSTSTTATVPLIITPVNDVPVVQPLALSTREEEGTGAAMVARDVDGDALAWSIGEKPAHGSAAIDAKGRVTYKPDLNQNGEDRFVVVVDDGKLKAAAAVSVAIAPVNDAPVATRAQETIAEDGALTATLAGSDVDGDALGFTLVRGPAGAVLDKLGALTWTPPPDFNGTETVVFDVDDGKLRGRGEAVLTVTPVNDAPKLSTKALATPEDRSAKGRAMASDIDGDTLRFRVAKQGDKGEIVVDAASGALLYAPKPDVWGEDVVVVAVDDGTTSTEAALAVSISAVPDAPRTHAATWQLQEDIEAETTLPGVDVDGDALTFTLRSESKLGTVRIVDAHKGTVAFTPRQDLSGTDEVTFEVSDGVTTVPGVLSMNIEPVNDAPVATPLLLSTNEDTAVSGTVLMNDVDGDALHLVIVSQPKDASVKVDNAARGTISIAPAHDFNGDIVFQVAAAEALSSKPVDVTISVKPVNDAPVALPQSRTTAEDKPITQSLVATDVDHDKLSYQLKKAPERGTVVIDPDTGRYTYTSRKNTYGQDAFVFTVSDGALSSTARVSLRVNPLDDPPVASDGTLISPRAGRVTGKLQGRDPEGSPLLFRLVSSPSMGKAVITDEKTGAYAYTPPGHGESGRTTFTFVVEAGGRTSAEATVIVDVN